MNYRVWKTKYYTPLIVFFLLSIFFIQAATSVVKRSNTWDESGHLLSGYAYLKNGIDYLEPSHPVLGRLIPAMPLLFFNLRFEPDKVTAQGAPGSNFYPYSLKFLFENNIDGRKLLFYSRLPMVILGVILGIYVFVWGRMLYGSKGGLLALFLYVLCPNILAHTGLVTTDFPLTAFFFIALFYLYFLTERITILRVFLAGITLGLALTTKYSALLIIIPYSAVFIYLYFRPPVFFKRQSASIEDEKILPSVAVRRMGELIRLSAVFAAIFLIAYLTVWAIYGFHYRGDFLEARSAIDIGNTIYRWEDNKTNNVIADEILSGIRHFHLLPESYIYGLHRFLSRADEGHAAFLMGDYSAQGWWYYFIVAFLIKTPIPVLYLFLGALLCLFKYSNRAISLIFFALPVGLMFFASLTQHINIGLRHILPIYPFMYVLIGGLINIPIKRKKLAVGILSLVLAWSVWASVKIYPYYLSYFNEFIGGPKNGYKYLVDSNLDWGQDLIGLKEYMDEHKIEKIKLSYFGFSDPAYYGINYEYLPSYAIPKPIIERPQIPLEGYFAISATMLQGVYLPDRDFYKLFREIEPVDTIGYSIFIYKFDEAKK